MSGVRSKAGLLALASLLWAASGLFSSAWAGDAYHGEALYQGCQDCHSLDTNDVGPKHRGVYGRKAGSIADYNYSEALKNAAIVWDEANLDHWLTDPQGFLPGAKMFYHLDDAKDRADVIEFLKSRAR
jgi:cytochrome c